MLELDQFRHVYFQECEELLESLEVQLTALQEALRANLPARHREFLGSLSLTHREGDYFFVHAGIRPGVPLDDQSLADLLWIREEFLYSLSDHGVVVVHGHTITEAPMHAPNRIGIDTGAYFTGRLTCLVLSHEAVAVMQS